MIVYDLRCDAGHRFEGWFGSSDDFAGQRERGLLTCPECGSADVAKAPMAPAVPAKGSTRSGVAAAAESAGETAGETTSLANRELPAEVQTALAALAKAQAKALEKSTWVGGKFAEQSREMHYGEREQAPIHGNASIEEAEALIEEGVSIAPLPFPVAPPDELN